MFQSWRNLLYNKVPFSCTKTKQNKTDTMMTGCHLWTTYLNRLLCIALSLLRAEGTHCEVLRLVRTSLFLPSQQYQCLVCSLCKLQVGLGFIRTVLLMLYHVLLARRYFGSQVELLIKIQEVVFPSKSQPMDSLQSLMSFGYFSARLFFFDKTKAFYLTR